MARRKRFVLCPERGPGSINGELGWGHHHLPKLLGTRGEGESETEAKQGSVLGAKVKAKADL